MQSTFKQLTDTKHYRFLKYPVKAPTHASDTHSLREDAPERLYIFGCVIFMRAMHNAMRCALVHFHHEGSLLKCILKKLFIHDFSYFTTVGDKHTWSYMDALKGHHFETNTVVLNSVWCIFSHFLRKWSSFGNKVVLYTGNSDDGMLS